jgi:hypothetical protein
LNALGKNSKQEHTMSNSIHPLSFNAVAPSPAAKAKQTSPQHSSASRTHASALAVILFMALCFISIFSASAHSANAYAPNHENHMAHVYSPVSSQRLEQVYIPPAGMDLMRQLFNTVLTQDITTLPQLSGEKIKLAQPFLMTVDPSDMTASIMSGVRQTENDDREFLAIKVKNTKTGEILTQVFHHKYANRHKGFDQSWTTSAGPIVTTSGEDFYPSDTFDLQRLLRGETVRIGETSWKLAN